MLPTFTFSWLVPCILFSLIKEMILHVPPDRFLPSFHLSFLVKESSLSSNKCSFNIIVFFMSPLALLSSIMGRLLGFPCLLTFFTHSCCTGLDPFLQFSWSVIRNQTTVVYSWIMIWKLHFCFYFEHSFKLAMFYRYVVVLDTTGKLMVLCGVTGLILWEGAIDDPPISDIALVQGDEHNTQFLLLLRNPDSKGCLLRIVSFPGEFF